MVVIINGVPVGLSDLHYALLDTDASGGAVYETPVRIAGAITANINPNSVIATLFADDGPMEVAAQLGNIEFEMNTADLPLEVQAILLGHAAVTAGIMLSIATSVPPWLAIGFKALKTNGKYRYVWLVKGKFREPELPHATRTDTVAFQTSTIMGQFTARDYDKAWMKRADEDAAGYQAETGTNWFVDGPDAP